MVPVGEVVMLAQMYCRCNFLFTPMEVEVQIFSLSFLLTIFKYLRAYQFLSNVHCSNILVPCVHIFSEYNKIANLLFSCIASLYNFLMQKNFYILQLLVQNLSFLVFLFKNWRSKYHCTHAHYSLSPENTISPTIKFIV